MPKIKPNTSAKDRFGKTGGGKLKRKKAFKNHLLTGKTKKRKRRLSRFTTVSKADRKTTRKMLGK